MLLFFHSHFRLMFIQQENDGIKMGNIKQSNGWRQTRDPCIEFKTQPDMIEDLFGIETISEPFVAQRA